MDAIKFVHSELTKKKDYPEFKAGDNITVFYKIIEGNKERVQAFKGEVVQRRGTDATQTFTVRKVSNGVGVDRIFPLYSPSIDRIELNRKGRVRRARIFYLRDLKGKKARIREKRMNIVEESTAPATEPAAQ